MANHIYIVQVLRRDLNLFELRAIARLAVEVIQHLSQQCFLLGHHSFLDHIGAMLLSQRAEQMMVGIQSLTMTHELSLPRRIYDQGLSMAIEAVNITLSSLDGSFNT